MKYSINKFEVNEQEVLFDVEDDVRLIETQITKGLQPYATGLLYLNIDIQFSNGHCDITATLTGGSNMSGFIHHNKGWVKLDSEISVSYDFTTGVNVIYFDIEEETIKLTNGYNNVNVSWNGVILEAFYSYEGGYTKCEWTSPFITKNISIPDEYCAFANPLKIDDMSKTINMINKLLSGGEYSTTYTNIVGSKTYLCTSSVEEGEMMLVSFSASSTIQCVFGVYFEDGTYHHDIRTLYNDQEIRYIAEKDVISTALYITSSDIVEDFTINVVVKGNLESIKEQIKYIENISLIPKPKSVKIFQRVGCIGDSYTAGYINTSQGLLNSSPNNAWPHYLQGLTNNHYDNWGVSGSTAKGWVLGAANLAKVKQQGNKCQAYIIGLMINDRSNASWNSYYTPVGVKSDIGTDNDSYYAYYYKLVQEIISVNPSAKIFCNTCPKWSEDDSYNIAVKDIVAYCKDAGLNVYLLDLASSKYVELYQDKTFKNDYINGHYTAIGYEYMAECYMQVISDVINENVAEFLNVAYIPFDEV